MSLLGLIGNPQLGQKLLGIFDTNLDQKQIHQGVMS